MAHNGKEHTQQSVFRAYSLGRDIQLLWQVGYQKADGESDGATSQRGTNSRQNAMESSPTPSDAEPSQRVKEIERLRKADPYLGGSVLASAPDPGRVLFGALFHHLVAQFGSSAVARVLNTRFDTFRTEQGTRSAASFRLYRSPQSIRYWTTPCTCLS